MGKLRGPRFFLLAIGLAVTIAAARPAMAGDAATILEGNHPDEAADMAGQTYAPPSAPLEMHLTMALRNRAEFDAPAGRSAGSRVAGLPSMADAG